MDTELLIQKYFKNELNSKEQVLFDDLLQNNTAFKNEVQTFKDLNLAIRNEERISLKKELKTLDANTKSSSFYKIMIAASFALLFSIGSYFLFKDNSLTNQELFATNFEPYRNVMHPVVRGDENLSKIEEAFIFYENNDFSKFIKRMNNANYTNIDYNFYIANAYLANGNIDQAKNILEQYLTNEKIKFSTKANWYLGLIYLKQNDLANAKKIFLKVKKSSDFKQKQLKVILKNLEP